MNFPNGIALAGKIASGKSTIAKHLAQIYGAPITSFGKMVRSICANRGIEVTRDSCQNLGIDLVQTLGADGLLDFAIKHSMVPDSANLLIIDGVRHIAVWEAAKQIIKSPYLLYIAADFDTRYIRYCSQQQVPISPESFKKVDNHPIEQEIENLQNYASITVDAIRPLNVVLSDVETSCRGWLAI